jgi:hypothetical protein
VVVNDIILDGLVDVDDADDLVDILNKIDQRQASSQGAVAPLGQIAKKRRAPYRTVGCSALACYIFRKELLGQSIEGSLALACRLTTFASKTG